MEEIKRIKSEALIIGGGAGGYAAAMYLSELGVKDVLLVSDFQGGGTSRNSGSDKQTYYKLSVGYGAPDSVMEMAEDIARGGSQDRDTALCEAAGSLRCFMRLCELGVGFPSDEYGTYVGYKTDHDTRGRATSAGPLTSKYMAEALEARARALGVRVMSGARAVKLLKSSGRAVGVLAVTDGGRLCAFRSPNIIFATGGAADIYADSVYPKSQTGALGVLLSAGAVAQNLTEWQYGLASVEPRWNVSGTYMQAIPRFISVDKSGAEYPFLEQFFESPESCLGNIFLKGYEWPFDSRKTEGSSLIDLLVYRERSLGRRVYLDYRENPYGGFEFSSLPAEAREYLTRADADFGKPIDRLIHMNKPAYELYLSRGVDLARERLEISLCAQHSNGGISVDTNWQTSISGLFAVGEAAGTHGVYRPGGSALNAGQVGAYRAASHIASHPCREISDDEYESTLAMAISEHERLISQVISESSNISALSNELCREMSMAAGAVRIPKRISAAAEKIRHMLSNFESTAEIRGKNEVMEVYLLLDRLYASLAVLCAMEDFYKKSGGANRGSAVYVSAEMKDITKLPAAKSPPVLFDKIQEIKLSGRYDFEASHRDARPYPPLDECFENVWKRFRENK